MVKDPNVRAAVGRDMFGVARETGHVKLLFKCPNCGHLLAGSIADVFPRDGHKTIPQCRWCPGKHEMVFEGLFEKRQRVVVEVSGGNAEATEVPYGIEVVIRDRDNIHDGDADPLAGQSVPAQTTGEEHAVPKT